MPSEKRARQRAARDAKKEAEARAQRRRNLIRNAIIVGVVAVAVVVLLIVLASRHSTPSSSTTTTTTKPSSTTTSTAATSTTTSPTTTTTAPATTTTTAATASVAAAQAAANTKAVAAGCPANPATRVNTMTWSSAPAMTITQKKKYTAAFKTTAGTFTVTLDARKAPVTVNNFVFLARQGFYKCVIFHRVIPNFMDQTGDPTGTGTGGPGYGLPKENIPKAYATGDVAMAASSQGPSGSQFFLVVPGGATTLDSDLKSGGDYNLFGTVSQGMTVVEKINSQGSTTNNGVPPKVTQRILSISVTTS